jgi:predicted aspartyl protease
MEKIYFFGGIEMKFIDKLRYLASRDFSIEEYSEDEKELYRAAKAFLLSDEEQAESIAKKLFHMSANEEVKSIAVSIILNLLVWQERFDELSVYGIPRDPQEAAAISLYNIKETKATLTNSIDCLNLRPSEVGWAVITVDINGHETDLMLDTGAGITVINETTAKQCGVELIDITDEALDAQDAHGSRMVLPTALIDSFSIGASTFNNKLCMVIPDSALDFGEVKINGTIGWELIKQLKWVLDFKEKKAYISSPKSENVCRNMAYDSFPLVKVTIDGKQLSLGLDTGATATMFGKSMTYGIGGMKQSIVKSGAAGGYKEETCFIIPKLEITVNGENVLLQNLNLLTDNEKSKSGFFITCGILGIDIAKQNILTVDYFNRHLSVRK